MLHGSPIVTDAVTYLAILVAVMFAVLWWRARTRGARRSRARQRRSRRGEDRAERLLVQRGFHILHRQPTAVWPMEVDGRRVEVRCRADWLVVARDTPLAPAGARLVAEVKTGRRAPQPTLPATRRQLLEYLRAFDVSGVVLVDMERERIRTVAFPPHHPRA